MKKTHPSFRIFQNQASLFRGTFFLLLSLIITASAWAEKTAAPSAADLAPASKSTPPAVQEKTAETSMITTEARRETRLDQSTRDVTVITREEIEKSGKIMVSDLLRGIAGVTVTETGAPGRGTDVYIRGNNSLATLIMLDGIRINNSSLGEYALQSLTTVNIERIEIVQGNQSSLYGANAVGGVINIMTRTDPRKGLHGSGNFQYGTFGTFYEEGTISESTERLSLSAGGSRLDTDGPSINDAMENTTYRIHGDLKVTENSDFDFVFHHFNAISGLQDGIVNNTFRVDPNRNIRSNEQALSTKYTLALKDWWQQQVQYSLFHADRLQIDPRNPDVFTGADPEAAITKHKGSQHTFEYQSIFHVRDNDILTLGYEFSHAGTKRKQNAATQYDRITRNHGWFGRNELTLWEIWTLIAGIRLDYDQTFGFQASPLFSTALWIAKTGTKLKGSFGQGYQTPSFFDAFRPSGGDSNTLVESTWSGDFGFDQYYWGQKGTLSAVYFQNKTKNIIVSSPATINSGENRSQGVELENRIKLRDNLFLNTTYTYTHAIDEGSDKRLIRIPRHQGKFGLSYDFKRLHFTGDWLWVGSREDTVRLDEYTCMDLALTYDLTKFAQIYGRIQNATNDDYEEERGYNMPHTGFYTGIRAKI